MAKPSFRWGGLAVLLVLVLGVATFLVLRRWSADTRRNEITAYQKAIKPLAFEGGRVVVEEVKPRISDLYEDKVTPEQFRLEAQRWAAELQKTRRDFLAVPSPGNLRDVKKRFDDSFAGYLEAIGLFTQASLKPDLESRRAALDAAIATAEQADKIYDAAGRLLEKLKREAGVSTPPSPSGTSSR